jgi:prevent-host-death family protein
MITITSVEAQNRFGQLLDTAQRETITITRRGRPVAVLMAVQEFEQRQAPALTARQAVAAFRGAGRGGTVEQLFDDRRADTAREPAVTYAAKAAKARTAAKKMTTKKMTKATTKTKTKTNAKRGRA